MLNTQSLQLVSPKPGGNDTCDSGRARGHGGQLFDAKNFLCFFEKALSGSARVGAQSEGAGSSQKAGDWLDFFKKALASLSEEWQQAFFSSKGLGDLKALLLREGFSKADVETFLKRLFDGTGRQEIGLRELLQKISEFRKAKKTGSNGAEQAASTIPHLETVLRSFGLDARETGRILGKARDKGRGLDLEDLACRLKAVLSKDATGWNLGRNEISADEIKGALESMGMKKEAAAIEGPLSFKEFVQIIAEKAVGGAKNLVWDRQAESGVEALLEHVRLSEKKTDSPAFSLSRKWAPFHRGNTTAVKENARAQKRIRGTGSSRKQNDLNGESCAGGPESLADRRGAEPEKWVPLGERHAAEVQTLFDRSDHQTMRRASDKNGWAVSRSGQPGSIARAETTGTPTGPGVRSIPLHVMDQVGRRLALALKRGETHVRLQLKPPDLGSIQLDLAMKDNGVKIAMVAEHQAVKDLILSHAHELKQTLTEQGVVVQRLDVEISYNFGHSMADAGGNPPKAPRWTPGMNSSAQEVDPDVSSLGAAARGAPHTDTLLDMFA